MSRQPASSSHLLETYRAGTLRPLNCLAFLLPLMLFFHLGVAYYGRTTLLAVENLKELTSWFGGNRLAYLPTALLLVAVLLAQHLAAREKWRVQFGVVAGMFVESALWMTPMIALGLVMGKVRLAAGAAGLLQADSGGAPHSSLVEGLVKAVGAGIYEEFIFRLLFIGLAVLLLVRVFRLQRQPVVITAALMAAVCFSLYHLNEPQIAGAAHFPIRMFVFRLAAGIFLGGLYIFRGFGIAVGAHAAFDVYLTLLPVVQTS